MERLAIWRMNLNTVYSIDLYFEKQNKAWLSNLFSCFSYKKLSVRYTSKYSSIYKLRGKTKPLERFIRTIIIGCIDLLQAETITLDLNFFVDDWSKNNSFWKRQNSLSNISSLLLQVVICFNVIIERRRKKVLKTFWRVCILKNKLPIWKYFRY